MRTQSFLPTPSRRSVLALTAVLAFALPSFAQLGAQATAKPATQAAAAKPTAGQPAATKASSAQPATAKPATAMPSSAQPAPAKPAATAAAKPATAAAAKPQVDINHATVKELKTIPGIGDAYAAKIVAGRPYANKSQLVSKKILAASLYETIQGMIIAKQ